LQGWTLSNEQGESFRFPNFGCSGQRGARLFAPGTRTPAALFWGRETPAWVEGETVTLSDSAGQVQATFRIGQPPAP